MPSFFLFLFVIKALLYAGLICQLRGGIGYSYRPRIEYVEPAALVQSVQKRFAKIEVCALTLNLKFIGTSANVDFA